MKPTCETLVPIAADIPIKEKRSLEKERGEHLPAREREREREKGGKEKKSLQKVRSDQLEGLHTRERGCRR